VLSGELSELLAGRSIRSSSGSTPPSMPCSITDRVAVRSRRHGTGSRGGLVHSTTHAVIGLGCRFPGDISSPDALWQFLSRAFRGHRSPAERSTLAEATAVGAS